MMPTKLAEAYARVATRQGLPAMQTATLAVETRDLADPAAAWDAFRDLAPTEGWVQFQSRVAAFAGRAVPPPEPDWGYLLAAEGVDDAGRSFALRQGPQGTCLLVIATPDAPGAETFLIDEVTHLGTSTVPGPLRYRRYWRAYGAMGPVPVFAALVGFGPKEDV